MEITQRMELVKRLVQISNYPYKNTEFFHVEMFNQFLVNLFIIQDKISEVVHNFQPLLMIETEAQISEDVSQIMKVDAHECQDYAENGECREVRLFSFTELYCSFKLSYH